jgi:N-hydroxyarylamine O-acetyltransferase
MDIKAYHKRIGYTGGSEPTLETLIALQKAHLLAVPFENLDIHRNIPIYIDPQAQFDKVVRKRRGGFCYELNSLFYQLLHAMKFETIMVSARTYNYDQGNFGPEYDHMGILVYVHNILYLVDVGFGDFAMQPLELDFQIDQDDARGVYRMRTHDLNDMLVSRVENYSAKPLYVFTDTPCKLREFEEMCKYHQTSRESKFTRGRLVTMPTEHGRKTLRGNTLTVTHGRGEIEAVMESEEEVRALLKREFDIDLSYS